jgi:hypothetical protein
MSTRVAAIGTDAPVAEAAERLAEQDVGVLAICRPGNRLSGVITDRDIVVRVVGQGLDPDALTVEECGSAEPATVSPQETLDQAAGAPPAGDRGGPGGWHPQPFRPGSPRRQSARWSPAGAAGAMQRRSALGSLAV